MFKRNFLWAVVGGFLLFPVSNAALAETAGPAKRIFIVHSYEEGHVCGQPQNDGAIQALKDAGWVEGRNVSVRYFYMDTKRTFNTPELIARQAQLVLHDIERFQPDILLSLDDNAFRTVALPLEGHSVKIVFSGLNGQPEDYHAIRPFMASREKPGSNITGVYEKLHIREAIKILSKMHGLSKVRILEDETPTGKAIARQVDLELAPQPPGEALPCQIDKQVVQSWEAFREAIQDINADPEVGAFYLGTLMLKDRTGATYTVKDIIDHVVIEARKPAMGPNYAFIKMGLYGGASVDFYAMGYQAGQKIAAILDGADPGQLPIEDAERLALVFNLQRARQLGLTIPSDILLAADEVF